MLLRGLVCCLLWTVVLVPSAEARGLRLGFIDRAFGQAPGSRDPVLDRAVASGSDIVRIQSTWAGIAPARPADPTDPADPAYRWETLDGAVKAARARGLDVIVGLSAAPRWAEGPGRPAGANSGTWRPAAAPYGAFARALARRYSGSYPDPGRSGAKLPRVRSYLPWNEPNLSDFLGPQWVRRDGRFHASSPVIYRRLLNAFARGVKAVDRRNLVVAGATAPFGDTAPGGDRDRIPPAQFVRKLLSRRTVFDVLAHHPYSVRGPRSPASNRDDVSVADLGKLRRPLRRAQRSGRISPRGAKRLWVTEVSWDSSPPDPKGVPAARHARWLQEAFYVLWRSGVDTIIWHQVRDDAPEPSFAATNQSGVYLRDGRPKLAQRSFAFPLVIDRRRRSPLRAWTRAPAAGTLVLERRTRRGWRPVRRVRVRRHQVILRKVPSAPRGTRFRARVGAATSLPWRS